MKLLVIYMKNLSKTFLTKKIFYSLSDVEKFRIRHCFLKREKGKGLHF